MQVPKGTVELGEAIEIAARREVREETGLAELAGLHYIGAITQRSFSHGGESEDWNFFAMNVDGDVPDNWIHRVAGKGEDRGMHFRYYWVPLNPTPKLAGKQHDGLAFLKNLSANRANFRE